MDPAHTLPPPSFGGRNSRNGGESSAMAWMSGSHRCLVLGKDEDWRVGGPVSPWLCHLRQVVKPPASRAAHTGFATFPEPPGPHWWGSW